MTSLWSRPALPAIGVPARLSPLMTGALALLLALLAAAAGFAAYAVFAPDNAPQAAAMAEWKAPLPAVVALGEPKPASADVQTLSRPIFDKNRRPAKKGAAAVTAPTTVAESPVGVLVTAIVKHDGKSHAYIVSGATGDWKDIGDKVDSWSVDAITADEVTLNNGAASARLRLYGAEPRADAPPAPAYPAAPPQIQLAPPNPIPNPGLPPPAAH